MIQAVVFDFDGVILESAECKTEAFLALYEPHGPDVVAQVHAHHLANLGISRFKKFAWIAEHVLHVPHTEADAKRLGDGFSALALAKVLAAPFVPGAEAALGWLGEQGIPAFVASGTPQGELEMIVEKRGLVPRFREVHGTPREKPAITRDILARLGLAPTDVLFVGDGTSDHDAAVATGTHFLARDTPAVHDEWMKRNVRRVPDLRTFPELVGTW